MKILYHLELDLDYFNQGDINLKLNSRKTTGDGESEDLNFIRNETIEIDG